MDWLSLFAILVIVVIVVAGVLLAYRRRTSIRSLPPDREPPNGMTWPRIGQGRQR
ncbi:MAG TPA: hypothetical protein VFT27_12105 [Actinomycetota bacterium]|nr:hypothetical protein [Actinomycetota bacterium]